MRPSPIILSIAISTGIHALVLFWHRWDAPPVASAPSRPVPSLEINIRPVAAPDAAVLPRIGPEYQSAEAGRGKNEGPQPSRPSERITESSLGCPFPHRYLSTGGLDVKPLPTVQVDRNPIELAQFAEGGVIDADLCIEIDGSVSRVIITNSTLPVPFERNVAEQFSRQHFSPGAKNGRFVPVRMKIQIKYQKQEHGTVVEKVPLGDR